MNTARLALTAALTAALLGFGAVAARADSLSAPAAAAALANGALAWDVRAEAEPGLPGAVRIDSAALQAWLQQGDLAALQAAVSQAGLDLSRDVVVYGTAGDRRAQALVASLQTLSRGRVHWLVGGAPEWAMSGRSLQPAGAARTPVPQVLVANSAPQRAQMASVALRGVASDAQVAAR